MHVRCYHCGWAFNLSREAMAAAVANLEATGATHHVEHCPRCRKAIKISAQQIRRQVPAAMRTVSEPAGEAPPTGGPPPPEAPVGEAMPEAPAVAPPAAEAPAGPVEAAAEPKPPAGKRSPAQTPAPKPAAKKAAKKAPAKKAAKKKSGRK